MTYFFSQLINGLQLGSIYALIALGYTMVYGIVKLINFAHGDLMMLGAYFTFYSVTSWDLPIYLSAPLAMLFCGIIGVIIERIAYKPLRKSTRLAALITAIGVSLFLQNICMLLFSSSAKSFINMGSILPSYEFLGLKIHSLALITIVSAIILMFILRVFVAKTKTGKAMRAVSEDMVAAQLMGINVNVTISITFFIGSALAAFASVLYIMEYPQVTPFMGALPGIKAFIAAVLGGIGIIPGAMIGGFLLGIVESITKGYIPTFLSQLSDAVIFIVLIIVLLFRPSGLLGKNQREKV